MFVLTDARPGHFVLSHVSKSRHGAPMFVRCMHCPDASCFPRSQRRDMGHPCSCGVCIVLMLRAFPGLNVETWAPMFVRIEAEQAQDDRCIFISRTRW